jgi:hypothetical protein
VEFIAEYSEWQAIGVPSNAPFYLDAPRSINGRMYTHQTMYLSVLSFPQNCKKGTQRNRYLHFLIKVGSQQQCSPKFSTCLIPMNSSANSSRPSKYRTGHYRRLNQSQISRIMLLECHIWIGTKDSTLLHDGITEASEEGLEDAGGDEEDDFDTSTRTLASPSYLLSSISIRSITHR